MTPTLKQFRAQGCLSWFFTDPATRASLLIDPSLALMGDYRSYIADQGLKLVAVFDTHTHADHFSATQEMRLEYGVDICMSEKTSSARPTRKYRHGERLKIGSFEFEMLETPGHTLDSACLYGAGMVFTGDTLFIGSSGRTDFPGASPLQQWESIHLILEKLPGDTLVLPAHDYNDYLFSTIETEKKKNAHWLIPTREQFIAMKNAESFQTPENQISQRIQFNLSADPATKITSHDTGGATACGTASAGTAGFASINVQKYRPKLEESAGGSGGSSRVMFLDVREPDEYQEGHMPQTRNIPLSQLGLHLPELLSASRVYVSCLSGFRSAMAAKTLNYLGLNDIVNVSGGFKAWSQAGFPVAK